MVDRTGSGKFRVMRTQYPRFSIYPVIHPVIHPLGSDHHPVFIFAFVPAFKNCSVNFLFFELNFEILCEQDLLFIVFWKLEIVRY
jgi:hypothetical protein